LPPTSYARAYEVGGNGRTSLLVRAYEVGGNYELGATSKKSK
jgi:hypothetical protein